jgi:hypothetical protein
VHFIVTHRVFEMFMMGSIIGNMLLMACNYEGATSEYVNILEKINMVFTAIFTIECIL